MMTPRERVMAALRKQNPDKTPKYAEFTPFVEKILSEKTGADDLYTYFNIESRTVSYPYEKSPDKEELAAFYAPEQLETLEHGAYFDEWGVLHVPGSQYHFTKMIPPLARMSTLEELDSYPFPSAASDVQLADLRKQVNDYHRQDLFVLGFAVQIFEPSWYLRGMEQFLEDLLLYPAFAEKLLDILTELGSAMAQDFAAAGVDLLVTGDDVAMQHTMLLAPKIWRTMLKPRLARVICAAKNVNPDVFIYYHSDGRMSPIIPELIEIGVEVLNPVQPECLDPLEVKRKWGDKLSFWGTVGTQTTLPFGSPAEVRDIVRKRKKALGDGGGLVLAPTHVIEPDVPYENILAFFEAANE